MKFLTENIPLIVLAVVVTLLLFLLYRQVSDVRAQIATLTNDDTAVLKKPLIDTTTASPPTGGSPTGGGPTRGGNGGTGARPAAALHPHPQQQLPQQQLPQQQHQLASHIIGGPLSGPLSGPIPAESRWMYDPEGDDDDDDDNDDDANADANADADTEIVQRAEAQLLARTQADGSIPTSEPQ